MNYLVSIFVFAFLVAPGIRLLLLAARSKQAPELFGGLYFIGASLGISLRIFGVSVSIENPDLAYNVNMIGHITLALGTIAMAIFTQRVFYPENKRVLRASQGLIAAIVGTTIYALLGEQAIIENAAPVMFANIARVLPTAWASYESYNYWRAMQKRAALGLSDPVVTNRFGLWTLWTAGVTALPLIALVIRSAMLILVTMGQLGPEDADVVMPRILGAVRVLFAFIVPTSVAALWLSFFPPKAYLDRVQRRAATS